MDLIHRIWFTGIQDAESTTKAYNALEFCRKSWSMHNPTYHVHEWNACSARALIRERFPWFYRTYITLPYEIQRVDAIRYAILYTFGGVYVDMDVECQRPLCLRLRPDQVGLVETNNTPLHFFSRHVSNCLMAATRPRHPFWLFVMRRIIRCQKYGVFMTRHSEIMYSTGPAMLNACYTEYSLRHPKHVTVLASKYYNPISLNGRSLTTCVPYTVHHGAGSWEGLDSKILIFMYQRTKIIAFLFLCIVIVSVV